MVGKRLTCMIATAALLVFGIVATGVARQDDSSRAKGVCCYNNPSYSGTCRVEPAEGETCGSILAYLNNPMSEGKNYCGGTKVREGWQQVECEGETSRSVTPTSPDLECGSTTED